MHVEGIEVKKDRIHDVALDVIEICGSSGHVYEMIKVTKRSKTVLTGLTISRTVLYVLRSGGKELRTTVLVGQEMEPQLSLHAEQSITNGARGARWCKYGDRVCEQHHMHHNWRPAHPDPSIISSERLEIRNSLGCPDRPRYFLHKVHIEDV